MVEVPDELSSLFSARIEERAGRYVVEIPKREVAHDAVVPGQTYRVALLSRPETATAGATEPGSQSRATSGEERDTSRPPVEEGEIRTVTIESLGDQGDGIAKVERGYVVIVPEGRPGDEPTVEIETVQENVAFASVVDTNGHDTDDPETS